MMRKLKMRNRLAIVLALMLVFAAALSACDGGSGGKTDTGGTTGGAAESSGGGGDAYSLYSAANNALQEAEGYQMDMAMTGKIGTGGEGDIDLDTTSHMEINDPNGDIEMFMTQMTKTMGQEMETTVYLKDGYMYSEALGMKTKTKLDASQIASQSNGFVDFPQDAIINQKIDDVDGGEQLSFTVKGDAMASYIMKQANLGEEVVGLTDGFTFGDMFITTVIDSDGNMTECSVKMSMEMDLSALGITAAATGVSSSTTTDMTTTMSNIKIGKVDIKAPTDLDSYQ